MATEHKLETEIHSHHLAPAPHKKSHWGFFILLLILGVGLGAAIFYELGQRRTKDQALVSSAADSEGRAPVVNVGRVHSAPLRSALELPGQTMAMAETPLYARADGYLKRRTVDIGDRVKKDQLLIELETPELDQQIDQARATLAQSKAALQQLQASLLAAQSSLKLADVTARRWKNLTEKGVYAKQDLDEKVAALELGQANVKSAEENINAAQATIGANEANLRRLQNLKSFDRIEAPFDGVITFRNQQLDIGTLVTAGNTSSSREMIRVAQIDKLRVYIPIPQTYAGMIHAGVPVDLAVDEVPGKLFHTKVDAVTHSVDSDSRTMLAMLILNNNEEVLLPGMYARARFMLPHAVNILMLPADALILPKEGPQVAIVGDDHKVHFQKVTIGRDYGAEVEIDSGLTEGQMVVLSPTDAVREGVQVDPKERK
jgi:RND family efflux transporter MFP subunit